MSVPSNLTPRVKRKDKRIRERPGRPTKRTDDRRAKLLSAISAGNTFKYACAYAGICEDLFVRWRHDDPGLVAAVAAAEAAAVVRNVALIQTAARSNWTAAAWWLERRFPDEWGRRERVEHVGPAGTPLVSGGPTTVYNTQINVDALPLDRRKLYLELLREMRAAPAPVPPAIDRAADDADRRTAP